MLHTPLSKQSEAPGKLYVLELTPTSTQMIRRPTTNEVQNLLALHTLHRTGHQGIQYSTDLSTLSCTLPHRPLYHEQMARGNTHSFAVAFNPAALCGSSFICFPFLPKLATSVNGRKSKLALRCQCRLLLGVC